MTPFVDFAARRTPLQPLDRLGAELGLQEGQLWVKRDDMTGLAGGGNKARKLEYLVADALDQHCDTLVTTGAAQSNHVRATAAAAKVHGLDCVAVLSTLGRQHEVEGNLVLDDLFDLEVVWTTPQGRDARLQDVATELTGRGKRPYVIPLGGTNALGAVGYVVAAEEIEKELPGSTVMCTVGTGGTQAGLTVGLGSHDRVVGFDIGALPDLADKLPPIIKATAELLGRPQPVGNWSVDTSQAAAPYGAPTPEILDAIRLVAQTTGLVLDPVYTGRAMAGLIQLCQTGTLPQTPLVFLHSGGMPALFTGRYRDWFKLPRELM